MKFILDNNHINIDNIVMITEIVMNYRIRRGIVRADFGKQNIKDWLSLGTHMISPHNVNLLSPFTAIVSS